MPSKPLPKHEPPLVLHDVERSVQSSHRLRSGLMFWSRVNGKSLHFSWSANPDQPQADMRLQMSEDQAKELRDWLIRELPK